MRKSLIGALTLMLALTVVASVSAATHAKNAPHKLQGTIESVNPQAMSLVVKTTTASETFKVTTATKLKANGKSVTLSDLKSGERWP